MGKRLTQHHCFLKEKGTGQKTDSYWSSHAEGRNGRMFVPERGVDCMHLIVMKAAVVVAASVPSSPTFTEDLGMTMDKHKPWWMIVPKICPAVPKGIMCPVCPGPFSCLNSSPV